MIARRVLALLAVTALLSSCTGEETPSPATKVAVDAVRQSAAQADPQQCPIKLDVPAAVRSAGVDRPVEFTSADAKVSTSDQPAADPVAAHRDGLSALDAAAGAHIECRYRVGDAELDVHVVATRAPAAVNLLAPQISRDAHLTAAELQSFLQTPPAAGQVAIAGGTVAVAGLAATGGDAAALVFSTVPELRDDSLSSLTRELTSRMTS